MTKKEKIHEITARRETLDAFLQEILTVFKKHQMCISFEEFPHGNFTICDIDEYTIDRLFDANDEVTK